eukprot:jgi/Hompol1/3541/HPOL_006596-RA
MPDVPPTNAARATTFVRIQPTHAPFRAAVNPVLVSVDAKTSEHIELCSLTSSSTFFIQSFKVLLAKIILATGTRCRARVKQASHRAWIAAKTNRDLDEEARQRLMEQWKEDRSEFCRRAREDSRKTWTKHADNLSDMLSDGRSRQAWNAAKAMTGQTRRPNTIVAPVRNNDGIVEYEPDRICETWRRHYAGLAADVTGNSRNREHWFETLDDPRNGRAPLDPAITAPADADISWNEILSALKCMHPRKAPGSDQIPVSFLRALTANPPADDNAEGQPAAPADGPPAAGGTGAKLVSKIVQNRIDRLVDQAELLAPEQGGFRKKD